MQAPGESSADSFPEKFGKYTLLANIATGGMGEVLLARLSAEAGFEKLVVIKRILPHLTDKPSFVKMFLDEARTVARLHHPNVCQTYELGQVEGQYYMAMEYLEGVTLKDVVRGRKRHPKLAEGPFLCGILIQACEGLHYAHALQQPDGSLAQLVHRDVNPRNILVTSAGAAKLLDFGIAKSRASLNETRAGAVKGTYAYMSPEQLRGVEQLDRRSDIFSLGVVTWEALTGTRLFKRDTDYKTFNAIVRDPIPRARDFSPDVPPELDEAVARALSRDRNQRYQTAREYALALEKGVSAAGSPCTSLAIAAEIEQAFEPELERQRALLLSSHRQTMAEDEGDAFNVPTTIFTGDPQPIQTGQPVEEIRVDVEDEVEQAPPPPAATKAGVTKVLPTGKQSKAPLPGLPPTSEPASPAGLAPTAAPRAHGPPADLPSGYTPPPQTLPGVAAVGPAEARMPSYGELSGGDLPAGHREATSGPAASVESGAGAAESSNTGSSGTGSVVGELDARPGMGRTVFFIVGVCGLGFLAFLLASHFNKSAPSEGVAAAGAGKEEAPRPADSEPADPPPGDEIEATGAAEPAIDAAAAARTAPPEVPAPADAAPPDARIERGKLAITATAPATVFVDGQEVGATPLEGHELEAGPHEVRVVARGKPPRAFRVRIPAGKTVRRSVAWESSPPPKRPPGFLTLDSKPYATVFINGKKVGFTPIVRQRLPAGVHDIRLVAAEGKGKRVLRLRIEPGKTVRRVVTW